MRRWFWFRFFLLLSAWNRNPIKRSLPFMKYRSIKFSVDNLNFYPFFFIVTIKTSSNMISYHHSIMPTQTEVTKRNWIIESTHLRPPLAQKWYKLVLSVTKICDCSPWCHACPCLLVSTAESRQNFFFTFLFLSLLFLPDCFIFVDVVARPVTSAVSCRWKRKINEKKKLHR